MVKMLSNPKGTCTSYHKHFLELSFRVIISSEGNLSVLCLGHCAMMGWCPLWKQQEMNSGFLLSGQKVVAAAVTWEEELVSPECVWKTVWRKPREISKCLLAAQNHLPWGRRWEDVPLSSASPSNCLNSLGLLSAVEAVLRHKACPVITLSAYC